MSHSNYFVKFQVLNMRFLCSVLTFLCLWCVVESTISLIQCNNKKLFDGVNEVIEKIFVNYAETINLIAPDNSELLDFKDKLLQVIFEKPKLAVRQESASRLANTSRQPRRNLIFLVGKFEDFTEIEQNISPQIFHFNGLYLIVLTNGLIDKLEDLFKVLWAHQIFNVLVMFKDKTHSVLVETFKPFNLQNCNSTEPVIVNQFENGRFLNGTENLFPEKMKNLMGCSVRVSIGNSIRPFVIENQLSNGSSYLSGRDYYLIKTLSESLNFTINFTYIGHEGYFYKNGSSEGPLRFLKESYADLSLCNWWLKTSRAKFFDVSTSYISDQIIMVVPSGRDLTTFEKLSYPFTVTVWILILVCFFVGFSVILIIRIQFKMLQNFVFGSNVHHPFLNMFIAFIGGVQNTLPRRNFARFLLMAFLMYSLVIRTLYQAAFYHLLQSNIQQKSVQSIDDMVSNDFEFYTIPWVAEIFSELETLRSRFVKIFPEKL